VTTRLLVLVPALVIGAGIVVLLLGRSATIQATDGLARAQLSAQATDVERDVARTLDQAGPMLERLRAMADPRLPIEEVAPRLVELVVGRPGVASASIVFPSGTARTTERSEGGIRVRESILVGGATVHTRYEIAGSELRKLDTRSTTDDERARVDYTVAAAAKVRSWTTPAGERIAATEPIFGLEDELAAVISVEIDIAMLSRFIDHSPLAGARTAVIAKGGSILHGPPAFDAVIRALDGRVPVKLEFLEVSTSEGAYLASVMPVGGRRGGVEVPLDWYLAALVPEQTLFAPARKLQRTSVLASAAALLFALGIAIALAWNMKRMRRDVVEAKAREKSANDKIRELGAYRLIDKLGAGGMGEVWRAQHRLLAREAAVKLVREEGIADEAGRKNALARFKREAETLAQMKSRHTIALYDYGVSDDGCFYYVMELLDGVDLDKLVREVGAIPAARVIAILVAACQSLGEAHEAGLLHRDIKPANIFLSRAADEVDVVKVLDFGIVHAIGDDVLDSASSGRIAVEPKLTREGALVGTPGFMAPELMRGEKVDGRSDLYALGCVAWWLLARGEVFPRPDGKAAMRNHMFLPVPDLRMHVHGWIPDELVAIVTSLLAKHPDERPANARELATRLRAIAIPEEHAWTEERARQWWATQRPGAGDEGKTVVDKPRVIAAMTLRTAPID
jgi:tRNA A-37 threonylcarbamoyl transferase component Bud32